jgi:hypothetical protein
MKNIYFIDDSFSACINAQQRSCGTTQKLQELIANDRVLLSIMQRDYGLS